MQKNNEKTSYMSNKKLRREGQKRRQKDYVKRNSDKIAMRLLFFLKEKLKSHFIHNITSQCMKNCDEKQTLKHLEENI